MARKKRVGRIYQTKKPITIPEVLKHISYVQLTGKTTSFVVTLAQASTVETLLQDARVGWHRRRMGDEVSFDLFSTADPDAEKPERVVSSFLKFFNIKEIPNEKNI